MGKRRWISTHGRYLRCSHRVLLPRFRLRSATSTRYTSPSNLGRRCAARPCNRRMLRATRPLGESHFPEIPIRKLDGARNADLYGDAKAGGLHRKTRWATCDNYNFDTPPQKARLNNTPISSIHADRSNRHLQGHQSYNLPACILRKISPRRKRAETLLIVFDYAPS